MEPSFFREMPKFKTPEEELDYLRAHVKAREEELISIGRIENAGDNAAHEVIGAYKNIPVEEFVHKESRYMSKNKTDEYTINPFTSKSHTIIYL